jgi:long-chain acyl-CoA synthetase
MTVLVRPTTYHYFLRVLNYLVLEFLICDLALAANSIPSFTISSASLLSPVLDAHPPSAIITDATLLPQVLELIYDSAEGSHHTIIVVGEPDPQVVSKVSGQGQARLFKWTDVESQGAKMEAIETQPLSWSPPFVYLFAS